jgi:hypothetical protein
LCIGPFFILAVNPPCFVLAVNPPGSYFAVTPRQVALRFAVQ